MKKLQICLCSFSLLAASLNATVYYIAPNGSDTNSGTDIAFPLATLTNAAAKANSGDTNYVRGGTYTWSYQVTLSGNGSPSQPIEVRAYPGEQPVFDFSGQPAGSTHGIKISGSWWHLYGLIITNAAANGINISGHSNTVERCAVCGCRGTGLHFGSQSNPTFPSYNTILNCEAYRNYDPPTHGENADGFAAKYNIGVSNVFRGCRSWENSDDGWDLWMATSPVLIENCWAFRNGSNYWNDSLFTGNGNGFKLGGNYVGTSHRVLRCVAFENVGTGGNGFDQNNNTAGQTVDNCTSWASRKRNFNLNHNTTNAPMQGVHTVRNNLSIAGGLSDAVLAGSYVTHNSWQLLSPAASTADLMSADTSLALAPREADGSLPENSFLRPVPAGRLVDQGIDIGEPFNDFAPDLGAFESPATFNFKWNQPPVGTTNVFYGWNQQSVHYVPYPAADDWVCTTTNPITKIRWWGSFTNYTGTNLPSWILPSSFWFIMWTDVPTNTDAPWSHPGDLVWQHECLTYTWQFVGWDYDPRSGKYESCFLFEQELAPSDWFYQTNGPTGTNIYWLSIQAAYGFGADTNYYWGWKTLPRKANSPAPDAAVAFIGDFPWYMPITWPGYWTPDATNWWDLAFELISERTVQNTKWEQLPDLSPNGMDVYDTDNPVFPPPYLLADDFQCTSPGYLTNITIWGSWTNDVDFWNTTFTLSIHEDVPAGQSPTGYSMPGTNILWTNWFSYGSYTISNYASGILEGWYMPTNSFTNIGDHICYQFDFTIPTNAAFWQQGTPESPKVYWLDVQAHLVGGAAPWIAFGWKTSTNHWNDDAVWARPALEPYEDTNWNRLVYPPEHPQQGQPVDMAFRLNAGSSTVEEIKWSQPPVLATWVIPNLYYGWNAQSVSNPPPPFVLADDWVCTTTNPVTDIHWWGSFIGWSETNPPQMPDSFRISIFSDTPAGFDAIYSHPSNMIWSTTCTNFTWSFVGWDFDPRNPGATPDACFKFDQHLSTNEWFYQTNGPTGTNIYWLSIAAWYNTDPMTNYWGWKTRPRDTNSLAPDDAVINSGTYPYWDRIWWPTTNDSWDLAFALTTCPEITLSSLPDGVAGSPYTNTITANGGALPHTFGVTSGSSPNGLNLASDGTLSGIPMTNGVFSFTVTVTDANGCTGSSNYTITVSCPTITVGPASLPDGKKGLPYTNTLTASGGTASYTFAKTSGNLPNGLSLAGDGTLSGIPTNNDVFNFTVTVTDACGCTGSSNYAITVSCPTITIGPASLPDGEKGVPYTNTLTGSGGAGSYSYALADGSGPVPTGLTLTSGGSLEGVPTTNDVFNFTVTATDAYGCTGSSNYTITVSCAGITFNPASLPGGALASNYTVSITVTSAISGPWTFTNTSGTLPPGLKLATNGTLSGIPFALCTNTFTVKATEPLGCTASKTYTLIVNRGTYWAKTAGTLTITTPLNKHVVSDLFRVSGTYKPTVATNKVTPKIAVPATVVYQFNGGQWYAADTTNSFTNWSATLPNPPVGSNQFVVYALDDWGNVTKRITNTYTYVVYTNLTVVASGDGSVKVMCARSTPPTPSISLAFTNVGGVANGPTQAVAQIPGSYKVVAKASAGYLLSNIVFTSSDGYTNTVACPPPYSTTNLSFPMRTNMFVNVYFYTNRFSPCSTGTYWGLFMSNAPAGTFEDAGLIKITVGKSPPKITGKMWVEGQPISFNITPNLDGAGVTRGVAPTNRVTLDAYTVTAQLDFESGNWVAGFITSSWKGWVSAYMAYRSPYGKTSLGLAGAYSMASNYTMVISNSINPSEPGGYGYATLTLGTNGVTPVAGRFGDTAKIAGMQTVNVFTNGLYAFYMPMYKVGKAYHGSAFGWLEFTNGGDWGGTLRWIKETNSSVSTCPDGFTNDFPIMSSPWTNGCFGFGTGQVSVLVGGLISSQFDQRFTNLACTMKFPPNKLNVYTNNPHAVTLSAAPINKGKVTGVFYADWHSATPKFTYEGAILQNQQTAYGLEWVTAGVGLVPATNTGPVEVEQRP